MNKLNLKDYIGKKFHNITILAKADPILETDKNGKKKKRTCFIAMCDCGTKIKTNGTKFPKRCRPCFFDKLKKYKPGDKLGLITVIGYMDSTGKNKGYCRLSLQCECGTKMEMSRVSFDKTRTENRHCGCQGSKHRKDRGYIGQIPRGFWTKYQSRSKERGYEWDLDPYLMDQLIRDQNYFCAISGLPIGFDDRWHERDDITASIDRIDSDLGYIEGNVQWVHKEINQLKHTYDTHELIYLCSKITQHSIKNKEITKALELFKEYYEKYEGHEGRIIDNETLVEFLRSSGSGELCTAGIKDD